MEEEKIDKDIKKLIKNNLKYFILSFLPFILVIILVKKQKTIYLTQ